MPRILLILAIAGGAGYLIYRIWNKGRKPKNACPKCDGLGYWEGLRGREKCDMCNGTGIYPPPR